MREIKYRAKKAGGNGWLYGTPIQLCNDEGWIMVDKTELLSTNNDFGFDNWDYIDSDTIGQSIGRTDMDSIDIYDGDILEWNFVKNTPYGDMENLITGLVDAEDMMFCIIKQEHKWYDDDDCIPFAVLTDCPDDIRIIGNKYDNKDLFALSKSTETAAW